MCAQRVSGCSFLPHSPVKLLPPAFSGKECVGADLDLGLGKEGGPQRISSVHVRVLK